MSNVAYNKDDFFASFNNNFDRNTPPTLKTNNTAIAAKFDAFSDDKITTAGANSENLFIANFDDEFDKCSIAVPSTTTTTKSTTMNNNSNRIMANFDAFNDNVDNNSGGGKFDAFGMSTITKNFPKNSNYKRNEALDVKHTIDRFADDFSKNDTFDNDLEEVLKRSLSEK